MLLNSQPGTFFEVDSSILLICELSQICDSGVFEVFIFLGILGLLWIFGIKYGFTMPESVEELVLVDELFVILVVAFVVALVTEDVVVLFFVAEEFAVVVDDTTAEFVEVSLKVDVGECCILVRTSTITPDELIVPTPWNINVTNSESEVF